MRQILSLRAWPRGRARRHQAQQLRQLEKDLRARGLSRKQAKAALASRLQGPRLAVSRWLAVAAIAGALLVLSACTEPTSPALELKDALPCSAPVPIAGDLGQCSPRGGRNLCLEGRKTGAAASNRRPRNGQGGRGFLKSSPPGPTALPDPPAHLSEGSKRLWGEIVGRRARSRVRIALLTTALEARDRAEEARQIVAREGMVAVTAATGVKHAHPMLKVERDNRSLFARCWTALGLAWDGEIDGRTR